MKVRERRRLEHSLAALAPQLVRKYFHPSPPPTLPLGRRICLIRVVFSIKLYSQFEYFFYFVYIMDIVNSISIVIVLSLVSAIIMYANLN